MPLKRGGRGEHGEVALHVHHSLLILPPSVHPTGAPYRWAKPPGARVPEVTSRPLWRWILNAGDRQAAPVGPRPAAGGEPASFTGWLQAHGIPARQIRRGRDYWMAWVPCPWGAEHSTPGDGTDTAVFWRRAPG